MPEINIERITPEINIDPATRSYHLPIASATTLGGIKVGNNLTIESDGTLNAESTEYDLPVATSGTLGGIKVGNGLNMVDQSLSVVVDANLDAVSTNPVRNSVVTSNVNTLTSSVQTVSNNLSTLSGNFTTLSGTVSQHTSDISSLQLDVSGNTDDIATNTNNIADNASDISDLSGSISLLSGRVDDAEAAISDLSSLSTTVEDLADSSLDTITYSYLLPVSTWISGNIFVLKRGKVGFIYFDIEGSLTLAANASSVIYTFADLVPAVKSSAVLLTDAGPVLGELDDYSYGLSLTNMGASSITITKVKGSIPLAFV